MSRCAWIAAALLFVTAPSARAHDPGMSTFTLTRAPEGVEFSLIVNHADLSSARQASAATCDAQRVLSASLDGDSVPVQVSCRLHDEQHTAFEGEITSASGGLLSLQLTLLDELPRGHLAHARVLSATGAVETQRLLTRGSPPLQVRITPAARRNFIGFGIVLFAVLVAGVGGLRRVWRRPGDCCKLPPHGL